MHFLSKWVLVWLSVLLNLTSLTPAAMPLISASGGSPRPAAPRVLAPAQADLLVFHSTRGYLTTPQELLSTARKAAQGIEPYQSAVEEVLDWANQPWDYRLEAEARCPNADEPAWNDNEEGTPKLYAKALAYHLTGQVNYAEEASAILERIMSEVLSITLEEQQCRLNFGWGTPELVASADLLEDYWQDKTCRGPESTIYGRNTLTEGPCKELFQNWLVKNPYYVVSYSAERSQSNWGAAATNATAYIADYVWDRPEMKLIARTANSEIRLSPRMAYSRARRLALNRMNGYRVDLDSNSACDFMAGSQQKAGAEPVKSQITELGIIPEDARRDEFCNIEQYDGSYQNYPQLHLGHNIQQCELMLRRGDAICYDNVSKQDVRNYAFRDSDGGRHTATLRKGRGSIERAIQAIIIDSRTEWRHDSALEVAYRYYLLNHTLSGIEQWFEQLDRPANCSQDICFGTLTHGFTDAETPSSPPVVKPPQ